MDLVLSPGIAGIMAGVVGGAVCGVVGLAMGNREFGRLIGGIVGGLAGNSAGESRGDSIGFRSIHGTIFSGNSGAIGGAVAGCTTAGLVYDAFIQYRKYLEIK